MVLFLGAPLLLCNWLVHSIALFFALVKIHRLSSYPLFWVLLACAYFCSTEARFSVENYLICSGFLAWALDRQWLTAAIKKRNLALIIIFVVSFLLDIFDKSILERGSLGLLLPGFLFLNISNQRNLMIILSLKALLSNKASTIIALVFTYIYRYSKKLSLFCFLAAAGTLFLFKNHFEQFWSKSIISRLYIWSSSFQGFSLKPLLGHGFGTFALDMPLNRIISDT
ncbi:MAG: hypothetical protein LW817_07160, partial [Candidatus Caenarcaniphilales bacterium]|nr:hypothetical protein [Candidatus Caenarcaniphilales bacterium]